MVCPKCNSSNVNVQLATETQLKNQHHGVIWWLFIGWWWVFFKWLFFTLPALLVKIFSSKKQTVKTTHKSMCVCQNCGHHWEVNR